MGVCSRRWDEKAERVSIGTGGSTLTVDCSLLARRTCSMAMPRDVFPSYDESINSRGEPDEVLKALLGDEVGEGDSEAVEPALDE